MIPIRGDFTVQDAPPVATKRVTIDSDKGAGILQLMSGLCCKWYLPWLLSRWTFNARTLGGLRFLWEETCIMQFLLSKSSSSKLLASVVVGTQNPGNIASFSQFSYRESSLLHLPERIANHFELTSCETS